MYIDITMYIYTSALLGSPTHSNTGITYLTRIVGEGWHIVYNGITKHVDLTRKTGISPRTKARYLGTTIDGGKVNYVFLRYFTMSQQTTNYD